MKLKRTATVVELLVAARELIGVRERWCIGAMANTTLGRVTAPRAPSAVSWCAIGALHKVACASETYERDEAKRLLDDEADLLAGVTMMFLNDEGNYARVLRVYDLAISQARELEAQS